MRYKMKINGKLCINCGACRIACMDENDLTPEGFKTFICHGCTARTARGFSEPCVKVCPFDALTIEKIE